MLSGEGLFLTAFCEEVSNEHKKVSAIFNGMEREKLEEALLNHSVIGYTLHQVRGHGVYNVNYGQPQLVDHLQIDIYTSSAYAPMIAALILETVSVNADSEGLVAILPVDELFWIHSKAKAEAEEFTWNSK